MKQAVDQLLAEDKRPQEYLQWLKAKTDSLEGEYTTKDIEQITERFSFLAYIKSDQSKIRYFYLSLDLHFSLDLDLYFSLDFDLYFSLELYLSLSRYLNLNLDQKFINILKKLPPIQILLKEELHNLFIEPPDRKNKAQWWEENGEAWREKLRQIMITHRNIGHNWQFTEQQKYLLETYRTANILLMECLGREAVIDRGVRVEIENTLFLPVSN